MNVYLKKLSAPMKKKLFIIFATIAIVGISVTTTLFFVSDHKDIQKIVHFPAPSVLGSVTDEMKSAGFWIGKHPYPDSLIMGMQDIEKFNRSLVTANRTYDIFGMPANRNTHSFSKKLVESINRFTEKEFFFIDSSLITSAFFSAIRENILHSNTSDSIYKTLYAVVSSYTHQRVLPTKKTLHEKINDPDFDYNMVSSFDIGEPVAVLYSSNDQKWAYTAGKLSFGWILKEDLAFFSKKQVKEYTKSKKYIYTIVPKTDIYLNSDLTIFHSAVRMGVKLPVIKHHAEKGLYEVLIPFNNDDSSFFASAFVESESVVYKELPLTARNIIKMAFSALNSPYGWGGMYMEQDCSRYIWQVFAPFGFVLPRNSGFQNVSGKNLFSFDSTHADKNKKELIIEHAFPGFTVLGMKGHIMLYLGAINGEPYAIHSIWAYRSPSLKPEEIYVINRTVVTDLTLGEGSQRGSLISRVTRLQNFTID